MGSSIFPGAGHDAPMPRFGTSDRPPGAVMPKQEIKKQKGTTQ
jgi:hypothetical protein